MSTKKDRTKFVKEVESILLEKGEFIKTFFDCKEFKIPTGKTFLTVSLHPEPRQKILYCVFMSFDKPSNRIGNPHSGKHNFHCSQRKGFTLTDVIEYFKEFLNQAIELN